MSGTALKLFTVDAFTDVAFKGNPAAVCPLPQDVTFPNAVLQNIALEMNLSETAFITLLNKADSFEDSGSFGLRWFTPKAEIKLCGHATLAATAVLFYKLGNKQDRILFKTLSGDLIVKREGDYLHMDFPVGTTVKQDETEHKELIAGDILERILSSLGDITGVSDVVYCESLRYMLVRLHDGWSTSQFEKWMPNTDAMAKANPNLVVLIVTTRGPPGEGYRNSDGVPYDFVCRCFAPWTNVPEDPVTGSAQTVLAHYWSQQLGKNDFNVYQSSTRGGELLVKLKGDRVEILGKAVLVMEGVLNF